MKPAWEARIRNDPHHGRHVSLAASLWIALLHFPRYVVRVRFAGLGMREMRKRPGDTCSDACWLVGHVPEA